MEQNQRIAAQILEYIFSGKSFDQALQLAIKNWPNKTYQLGAVKDYVYGVLRYGWELKFYISKLCKQLPESKIENLLMIAIYQLVYTEDMPYTIVSQAVEASEKLIHAKLKGFVNGVLRTYLRKKNELFQQSQKIEIAKYNHPSWWIDKIKQQYKDQWEELLLEAQKRAPLTLRVNQQLTTSDEYINELVENDKTGVVIGQDAVVVIPACSVEELPGFKEGKISVQDLSAQLAVSYLDLFNGARVLDACAAPGGKTCHILEQNIKLDLLVLDKSGERIKRIEDNIKRLRLPKPTLGIKVSDAKKTNEWWDGKFFDRILIDAPCTGSGVVRRHPDIKWLRRENDIIELAKEQRELLDNLWKLLKPTGKIIYVTCSIFKEETVWQIEQFLKEHTDAKLINKNMINFIKPDTHHDGFYYAVCEKV